MKVAYSITTANFAVLLAVNIATAVSIEQQIGTTMISTPSLTTRKTVISTSDEPAKANDEQPTTISEQHITRTSEDTTTKTNDDQTTITEESESFTATVDESTTLNGSASFPTLTPEERQRCSDLTGNYIITYGKENLHNVWNGTEVTYDLYQILEQHGGVPGKLNVTHEEKPDPPVLTLKNVDERPLPDAEQKYWLYGYGASDGNTYIRIEHAINRFSNTSKSFVEIRGEIYWAPPDFCGNLRRASYIVDDRGFNFEVYRGFCYVYSGVVGCAAPPDCLIQYGERLCTETKFGTAPLSALVESAG